MEQITNFENQNLVPITPQKNIFKILFFIFLGLFLITISCLATILIVKNKNLISIKNSETTPTPTIIVDETNDWKTYENKEIGFSFKYPSELSLIDESHGGLFVLNIPVENEFPVGLVGGLNIVTGITVDGGGSIFHFYGYTKKGNQINYNPSEVCDPKLIKKIYKNSNGVEIILFGGVLDPNYDGMPRPCETGTDIGALVNTKSKIYPGLIFTTNPMVKEVDFLKILDTLKIEDPQNNTTQDWQTYTNNQYDYSINFSVKYPDTWTAKSVEANTLLVTGTSDDSKSCGNHTIMCYSNLGTYVSGPGDYKNQPLSISNYLSSEKTKFFNITKTLINNSNAYSVFENTPNGTYKEFHKYFIEKGDGSFCEISFCNNKELTETENQFLNTFKFN